MSASNTVHPDPDRSLVDRAQAGDFGAFEQLVGRHDRRLYNLALRMVRIPEDAEEVVQESFLSAVGHLKGFRGESAFATWITSIATNHALKLLRKRRGLETEPLAEEQDDDASIQRPQFVAPWAESPAALAARRETLEHLEEALDRLPEKYRLVFALRDVEELSTEETARALDISVANVKVRLLRARLMLREDLTRRYGDPADQIPVPEAHDS